MRGLNVMRLLLPMTPLFLFVLVVVLCKYSLNPQKTSWIEQVFALNKEIQFNEARISFNNDCGQHGVNDVIRTENAQSERAIARCKFEIEEILNEHKVIFNEEESSYH